MSRIKVGDVIGRLTIMTREGQYAGVRCRCGVEKRVRSDCLKQGTLSCGCLGRERRKTANTRHGRSHSRSYRSWQSMKTRCDNPKDPWYHNYGGRGITYDPRWSSFEEFFKDMGVRPRGTSLERRDNDGPYCKKNCRWATREEQNRNKRNSLNLTYEGRTQNLRDWASELGKSYDTLFWRLYRSPKPWSVKKAFST